MRLLPLALGLFVAGCEAPDVPPAAHAVDKALLDSLAFRSKLNLPTIPGPWTPARADSAAREALHRLAPRERMKDPEAVLSYATLDLAEIGHDGRVLLYLTPWDTTGGRVQCDHCRLDVHLVRMDAVPDGFRASVAVPRAFRASRWGAFHEAIRPFHLGGGVVGLSYEEDWDHAENSGTAFVVIAPSRRGYDQVLNHALRYVSADDPGESFGERLPLIDPGEPFGEIWFVERRRSRRGGPVTSIDTVRYAFSEGRYRQPGDEPVSPDGEATAEEPVAISAPE